MTGFGAILCDPPWKFEAYSHKGITQRSAESKYRTSAVDVLKDLPVEKIAAKDCCCFMWVVDSHLDQGIELLRAWGFTYKTIAFVWVKTKPTAPEEPRMGMGLWTRKETEICILGKRGSPPRRPAYLAACVKLSWSRGANTRVSQTASMIVCSNSSLAPTSNCSHASAGRAGTLGEIRLKNLQRRLQNDRKNTPDRRSRAHGERSLSEGPDRRGSWVPP